MVFQRLDLLTDRRGADIQQIRRAGGGSGTGVEWPADGRLEIAVPPIPATLSPMILIVATLVSFQAVANLVRDWNRAPVVHTAADEIDQDEIAAMRKMLGDDKDV